MFLFSSRFFQRIRYKLFAGDGPEIVPMMMTVFGAAALGTWMWRYSNPDSAEIGHDAEQTPQRQRFFRWFLSFRNLFPLTALDQFEFLREKQLEKLRRMQLEEERQQKSQKTHQ